MTSQPSQFLGPWQDQIWKYMCHSSQRDDYYIAELPCNANKNLEVRGVLGIGLHFHQICMDLKSQRVAHAAYHPIQEKVAEPHSGVTYQPAVR